MINEQRIVDLFLKLVGIDSPSRSERQLAVFLKAKLAELGLEVSEDNTCSQTGSSTGNIIARLPGTTGRQPIFFSAHMDTVEPGRGIIPVIKDGVISSQGDTVLGGDDKAGIAAILEALQVIKEHQVPHGGIEIVFTVCEEIGLLGAAALEACRLQAKQGYVLDAGGPVGTIIVKGPSQAKVEASFAGKAAHAGVCPEAGINAITAAAKAISVMRQGRIDSETTANIGIIEGGKATNIVPDLVNIKGEARSLNPAKLEAQVKHMREVMETIGREAGAQVKVSVEQLYPNIDLAEDAPAVLAAVEAARRLGIQPRLEATGGGSDANLLIGKGLTAVNLGIGMDQVHTTQERLLVADLVLTARYLLEIVRSSKDAQQD